HRLTNNYVRIGGVAQDLYDGFEDHVRYCLKVLRQNVRDVLGLVKRNRIFLDRSRGVGVISREEALHHGWTGPCLRASGVEYDVRKAHPYSGYENFDFDVPTHTGGDVYSRYLVRMEEMRQSLRIIRQAVDTLPAGPVMVDDKSVALPPKHDVYSNIEALMNHFKLIMHGILPPKGEVYSCIEGANGELGFYIVSDGTKNPYRVKVRPPCFAILQAMEKIIEGHMVADLFSALGSLNIIAGELDR
ncbi:MAG: NADH-quinone oxidoreductase subunit D, partial [bacterium]